MLFTQPNHFNWSVDNFGATTTDAAHGTSVPSDAAAYTKGANTALLAGIAHDAYGMTIMMGGGATTGTIRRQLTDILIDPAAGVGNAGSSWSVKIANLFSNSPSLTTGEQGWWFYFPIFIPAGTAIGAAMQDVVGTSTIRVGVRLHGQPTRPDLLMVGTQVQTIGADTANTAGTAYTPGVLGAQGSYSSSIGTLTYSSWWWQVGVGTADASMGGIAMAIDVAANATNKIVCLQEVLWRGGGNETCTKSAIGSIAPFQHIGAGQDVYVRGRTASSAADTTNTAVVYAVS